MSMIMRAVLPSRKDQGIVAPASFGAAVEEYGMEHPDCAPEGIDLTQPSAARIYDYWLGGTHNFAVDREIARGVTAVVPDTAQIMQANRAFLHRAVGYLVGQGIRQFLDLGSGIPTLGNVHEEAQKAAPDSKVVYVDIDPVAVAHSRHILTGNGNAAAILGDLRNVKTILDDPTVRSLLDFGQPVAVLMMAVLHFVPDSDNPIGVVARFRDALVPGSYLVLSHGTQDAMTPEARQTANEMFARTSTPFNSRPRDVVMSMFDGFDLVEPGLVWSVQWRPEHPDDVVDIPERSAAYVGVGRKR
jgi:S-adenosyl methyltransferase